MTGISNDKKINLSYKSSCLGVGGAFIDIIAKVDDQFLQKRGIKKGSRIDLSYSSVNNKTNTTHHINNSNLIKHIDDHKFQNIYCTGGSAANTIYNMHVLGEKTSFVGTVTKDKLGEFFVDVFFREKGISSYWQDGKSICFKQLEIKNGSTLSTSVCLVFITPDGERTMLVYTSASKEIEITDVIQPIKQTSGIFTESYELVYCEDKNLVNYILQQAEELDLYTAISLSDVDLVTKHRDFINSHLQRKAVKVIFGTEDEFMALVNTDSDGKLLDYVTQRCAHERKIMVITRADKGAWVIDDQGKKYDIATVPVTNKVVDTTGAGDGFAAGYLLGYVKKIYPPALCGKIGALVASNIVQCMGSNLMNMSAPNINTLSNNIDKLISSHK